MVRDRNPTSRAANELPLVKCGILRPENYGRLILAVATVAKIFTAPGQSPIIGLHIDGIIKSLNLTRTKVTLLYLIATCCSSVTLPLTGKFIDAVGPRISCWVITTGLCFSCFLFSQVRTTGILLLCFYLLRFFGQGSLLLVAQYTINLWWVDSRGIAMGIGGSFMSLGIMGLVAPWCRSIIRNHDWRYSYQLMSGSLAFVMVPLGFMFFRSAPESFGLLPDGRGYITSQKAVSTNVNDSDTHDTLSQTSTFCISDAEDQGNVEKVDVIEEIKTAEKLEEIWKTSTALRTTSFWSIAMGTSLIAATGTAYWFHMQAICTKAGISDNVISMVFPLSAVTSVVARLIGGRAIDIYEPRILLVISLVANSIGLFAMTMLDTGGVKVLYFSTCFMSISNAIGSNTAGVAYAQFFGRSHLASISSVGNSMIVLGSALGPFPYGLVSDLTGSFYTAFVVSSVIPILVAIFVFVKGKRPQFNSTTLEMSSTNYRYSEVVSIKNHSESYCPRCDTSDEEDDKINNGIGREVSEIKQEI